MLVAGQAEGLRSAGWDVGIACYADGRGPWPEGVRRWAAGRRLGAPQRSGPSWRRPLLDAALARCVARAIDAWAPSAIVAHHVEGLAVAHVARRWAGRRAPIAWVPHTLLGEELPAYVHGGLPGAFGRAISKVGGHVDQVLPRWPDLVLPLSRRGVEQARRAGASQVTRMPPGVDPEALGGGDGRAFRRRLGLGPATPIVLYTGNADRYQDVPDLVEASRRLPADTALVLLTHGSDAAMAARVAEGGGGERVFVVGDADLATLRDGLAAATVGVAPRRVCAGFPMKVLHHLAAAHPVVMPQAVAPPIEGVCPAGPGGPSALAGALGAVLSSEGEARRLGRAGAREVRARWTWTARGQQLSRCLEGMIAVP